MAFPYLNSLAEYTAVYPGEVYAPREFKNESGDGYAVVDETFDVPASADGEGRRRMNLDLVPLDLPGVTVEVDTAARAIVPYGEAPAAGEVALSLETGVIEFHSSDAGDECVVSYTGRGTPVMAYAWVAIQKELAATQTALDDLGNSVLSVPLGLAGGASDGTFDRTNGPAWVLSTSDYLVVDLPLLVGSVVTALAVSLDISGDAVSVTVALKRVPYGGDTGAAVATSSALSVDDEAEERTFTLGSAHTIASGYAYWVEVLHSSGAAVTVRGLRAVTSKRVL